MRGNVDDLRRFAGRVRGQHHRVVRESPLPKGSRLEGLADVQANDGFVVPLPNNFIHFERYAKFFEGDFVADSRRTGPEAHDGGGFFETEIEREHQGLRASEKRPAGCRAWQAIAMSWLPNYSLLFTGKR